MNTPPVTTRSNKDIWWDGEVESGWQMADRNRYDGHHPLNKYLVDEAPDYGAEEEENEGVDDEEKREEREEAMMENNEIENEIRVAEVKKRQTVISDYRKKLRSRKAKEEQII